MKEIVKIEILSLGKVFAICFAIAGLLIGLFIGLIGASIGSILLAQSGFEWPIGPVFGILAMFAFPILYGIMGFVAGILGAVIYNLVAKWVGGIEIELKDKKGIN